MPTNREQYLRKMKLPTEQSYSISELARFSGLPRSALQEVYNRGIGAYNSNLESVRLRGSFAKNPDTRRFPAAARLSKEQWAAARLYSFLNKGKTYHTADADIARRIGY